MPDGSYDDAIHVRDPRSATRTVCDQDISELNVVEFGAWDVVDWAAGCWGCITEARDMAAITTTPSPTEDR